ncbi:MAG: hypothetical protein ACRD88_06690, partial [Terriglobia bacterium]
MALIPEFLSSLEGFQWDEGNSAKSWQRHDVSQTESEQVFPNRPVVVSAAQLASGGEARHRA